MGGSYLDGEDLYLQMKVIKLKTLPTFDWTSPRKSLTEKEVIKWAGERQVYWCTKMDIYLVRADEETNR